MIKINPEVLVKDL